MADAPPGIDLGWGVVAGVARYLPQSLSDAMGASSHLYLAANIDLDRAVNWLAELNAHRPAPDRLVMAALFLKAVTHGLRDVPELNGTMIDGEGHPSSTVHLGVAVARWDGAPIVAVLPDAGRRGVDDVMRMLRDLVRRARTDRLRETDLPEPTFTVTHLGYLGVQAVFPSIVPPLVGAVGFGKVVEQPSAVQGAVVCSPVVTATLAAADSVGSHRGARFLATIDRVLQRPEAL